MKPTTLRLLSLFSITGAYMVSTATPNNLGANLIWAAVNPALCWHNFKIGQKEQALLFAVFALLAWSGIYNLSRGW